MSVSTAGGGRARAAARAAAVVALAATAVLLVWVLFFNENGRHHYKLLFENAGQLVAGNEVQIGGHPVGSVESIELTDDSVAEVEISLDQELHEGTKAVIRATSLAGVANRYVSISPGPNSEPALEDGAVIGLEDTAAPVDLDQVLNAFTPRTREGLSNFIKGQAGVYRNRGPEANRSYKYLQPALSTTNAVLDEINSDQVMFERFIVSGAEVFSALAERDDELADSVDNANAAFAAIASENRALDQTLERLPNTFRQSNTAFVNLRAALDDLDSLVNTAKPATEDLTPFLRKARPVVTDAVPVFTDFRDVVARPGKANDLGELTAILPEVRSRANRGFASAERAIADFQPTLDFARPYSPEMLNSLVRLGQITGYYDGNGHYARSIVSNLNVFDYDEGTGVLDPLPAADQFAPFGTTRIDARCPGGTTQPAPDNSNPFFDPPWPASGLSGDECEPGQVPAGP